MATAAKDLVLQYTSNHTDYNNILGIQDLTLDISYDELETTGFNNNSDVKHYIGGLEGCDISMSGDFLPDDTGQKALRTNRGVASEDDYWLKVLFDGTNGFTCPVIVLGFSFGNSVSGKNTISFKLKKTGALTEVGDIW